ncbi:MAG: pseudouridine synthase [Bdellovibrionales bacterium]
MSDQSPIRLSKYMSQIGLCSRREADQFIEKGLVKVNGEIISTLGKKIVPPVKVELLAEAKKIQDDKLSVILYKPIGYVSGPREIEYPSALDLVVESSRAQSFGGPQLKTHLKNGLAPVGRLDVNTTGLLILSSYGPLVKKVIGPDSTLEKEYIIRTASEPTPEQIEKLASGTIVIDETYTVKPAKCHWNREKQRLHLILTEGKKRQVRKMCEAAQLEIVALKRIRVGPLTLKGLKSGEWRYLSFEEINQL